MPLTIALEAPAHGAAIHDLHAQAFDAGWPARPAARLRHGVAPLAALSVVAHDGPELVASIRHYPVGFGHARHPGLMLGPVAVAADRQGQGIGRHLVRLSLGRAAGLGWRRVLLVGDPAYYEPLGFAMAAPFGLTLPGADDRLMVRALAPGGLDGIAGPVGAGGWLRRAA